MPADSALCCAKTLLPECHPVGARVLSDIRRALVPSPRLQPTEPQGSVRAAYACSAIAPAAGPDPPSSSEPNRPRRANQAARPWK